MAVILHCFTEFGSFGANYVTRLRLRLIVSTKL